MCIRLAGFFDVNHNLRNARLRAREIAMSDNSLHSLQAGRGDAPDVVSERETCSGILLCVCAEGLRWETRRG